MRLLPLLVLVAASSPAHADRLLAVANRSGSTTLFRYDDQSADFTVVADVPTCDTPTKVAILRGGLRAYVACSGDGSVRAIHTGTRVVTTLVAGRGGQPRDLVLSADESKLYVSSLQLHDVTEIALATGAQRHATLGATPDHLALSPDGTLYATARDVFGFVAGVFRIDPLSFTATQMSIAGVTTNEVIGGIAVGHGGDLLVATGLETTRVYYIDDPSTCAPCSSSTQVFTDLWVGGVAFDDHLDEAWIPVGDEIRSTVRPLFFPVVWPRDILVVDQPILLVIAASAIDDTVEIWDTITATYHRTLSVAPASDPSGVAFSETVWRPFLTGYGNLRLSYRVLGVTVALPIRYANMGAEDAHVIGAQLEGPPVFAIVDGCKGKTLKHDAVCTVDVRCSPREKKTYTARVTMRSDAENKEVVSDVVCAPR
jgi:DNA-binding beta-propeller fold protein YncE